IINADGTLKAINESWFGGVDQSFIELDAVRYWSVRIGVAVFGVFLVLCLWHWCLAAEVRRRRRVEAALRVEERERSQLIAQLQHALDEIQQLQGILPICAQCKMIRDESGAWNQMEAYVRDHSEATFSHTVCPTCAKKLYPDIELTP
ncbi:MAG: hypothetical protein ACYTGH_21175, partial [Planctomycetota bacterium]